MSSKGKPTPSITPRPDGPYMVKVPSGPVVLKTAQPCREKGFPVTRQLSILGVVLLTVFCTLALTQDERDSERKYRSAREMSAAIVRLEREVERLGRRVATLEAPPREAIASTGGPPIVTEPVQRVGQRVAALEAPPPEPVASTDRPPIVTKRIQRLEQRVAALESPPWEPIASTGGPPVVTKRLLAVRGIELELKPVQVVGCRFLKADSYTGDMPGVEISSNGLVSIVSSKAYDEWMRLTVVDSDQGYIEVFAQRARYGQTFATLPRDTTLDIVGVVVPLTGLPGRYGIVATRIAIKP